MLINVVCIFALIIWIFIIFKKKNIIHPMTFILLGFFLPLFLYNLNWSNLIDTSYCFEFNYLIIVFLILCIFYILISCNKRPVRLSNNEKISLTKFGIKILPFITIIWILSYLVENYYGSGTFFPSMHKIDAHKISMPIISYITSSSFIVTSFDFFAYKATKKKKFLIYIAICIALPVVTRSARMSAMVSILQLLCLVAVFHPSRKVKKSRKEKLLTIGLCMIVLGFIMYMALLTNYRMNHYGKYNLDYGNTIEYTGPSFFGILPVYYGYFPMSFNNLKINLLYNSNVHHNYIGLYSYTSIWFGVLQLDNLFGIQSNGYTIGRLVTSGAATVATGFWEFWYDYGYLSFLPMIIALIITSMLSKKAASEHKSLFFRTLYAWYIPFWFFTSFQNVLFQSANVIVFIVVLFLVKKSFIIRAKK